MKKILMICALVFGIVNGCFAQNTAEELYQKAQTMQMKVAAHQIMLKSAKKGYAPAQYSVAVNFETGNGVMKSHKKALQFFEQAAAQGHIEALSRLGQIYHFDFVKYGITQDIAKAKKNYLAAAEKNSESAQYYLGYIAKNFKEDFKDAETWYKKVITCKSLNDYYFKSLLDLGECYENGGDGFKQDYEKAYDYYCAANVYENKNYELKKTASNCVYRVKPIVEKIQKERRIAKLDKDAKTLANSRDTKKLNELAAAYAADGEQEKAFVWYKKSALLGNVKAQYETGRRLYFGTGCAQNYKDALVWFKKAAAKGDSESMIKIGACYEYGNGVAKSYSNALVWYRKAAAAGSSDGQTAYKNLEKKILDEKIAAYRNTADGYFATGNYASAAEQYKLAAQNSNSSSDQYNIGLSYEKLGQYKSAVYWYEKAANNGNSSAQNNLGVLYYKGLGVEQNKYTALEWYKKAANNGNSLASSNYRGLYNELYPPQQTTTSTATENNNTSILGGLLGITQDIIGIATTINNFDINKSYDDSYGTESTQNGVTITESTPSNNTQLSATEKRLAVKEANERTKDEHKKELDNIHERYEKKCPGCDGFGKCKACNGTGKCRDCEDCYFIDEDGNKVGADELRWKRNLRDKYCDRCKGTGIEQNGTRCGSLTHVTITGPDGHTYGVYGSTWRSYSILLCSNCKGTMKCPLCEGSGKCQNEIHYKPYQLKDATLTRD